MLVLTRKSGERIRIGDDIVISILEVGKGVVRVGVDAPKRVPIYRHEVYERLQEENLMASQGIFTEIENAAKIWQKRDEKE